MYKSSESGTIFNRMNTSKDLNAVLKDRSSKNERERERERSDLCVCVFPSRLECISCARERDVYKYDVFYNLITFCRNQSSQPGLDKALKGENSE